MLGKEIFMAIDPDIEGSGVAVFYKESNGFSYGSMSLPEITEFMRNNAPKLFLIIEAGYLNKTPNFHGGNYNVAQKIAACVGRNWQVAYDIVEFAKFYHVAFKEQKPLPKFNHHKVTEKQINAMLRAKGFGPIPKSNQDQRDALRILIENIF